MPIDDAHALLRAIQDAVDRRDADALVGRATLFAVRTDDGWRLRQFHGSIPSDL